MYAMIGQFNPEKQQEQRDELTLRIKLLREIVGQEIDRIKGTAAPIVPKEWKKLEKIEPEDTDIEKMEKYKYNSMVITKKPYFFRYLYPELNKKYKQYEASYNQLCLSMFGIKLKPLLAKEDKTDEEKRIIRNYQRNLPLITSNCTMNILCREFEDVDFDIVYSKQSKSMLPTFEDEFEFDATRYQFIRSQYQTYCGSKQVKTFKNFFNYELDKSDVQSLVQEYLDPAQLKISDLVLNDIRAQLFTSNDISPKEFLFYCSRLAKQYKQFNWGFAWEVLDTHILNYIERGVTLAPVNLKEVSEEAIANDPSFFQARRGVYLGQEYILKDVSYKEAPVEEDITETYKQYEQVLEDNAEVFENIESVSSEIEAILPDASKMALTEDYLLKDGELPITSSQEEKEKHKDSRDVIKEEDDLFVGKKKKASRKVQDIEDKVQDIEEEIQDIHSEESSQQDNSYTIENTDTPLQTMGDLFSDWFNSHKDDDEMDESVENKD